MNNILAMKVDMIVMRHATQAPHFLSRHQANIVNAGDGHTNIRQALPDAYSIREKLGSVTGKRLPLSVTFSHSRVALSNIFALHKSFSAKSNGVRTAYPVTQVPRSTLGVLIEYDVKGTRLVWCCKRASRFSSNGNTSNIFHRRRPSLLRH